ncbi:MAG: anaerobic ribonucleoside-triphosphate reductase activating protein [Bacteroidales bacterium]|nr:anaerobic ribonucleoside-triphosphate reductase activating protein [Bacteroidales bacterium]
MLKYFNYDVVFQEIPNEVTLAVNFSLCPNKCKGCHSPWLWQDKGEIFDSQSIDYLFDLYKDNFTCFGFMGGDNDPQSVNMLAKYIRINYPHIKTAWYSGKNEIPKEIDLKNFNYIKTGPYIQEYGSLKDKTTNQKLLKINTDLSTEDITNMFWKK